MLFIIPSLIIRICNISQFYFLKLWIEEREQFILEERRLFKKDCYYSRVWIKKTVHVISILDLEGFLFSFIFVYFRLFSVFNLVVGESSHIRYHRWLYFHIIIVHSSVRRASLLFSLLHLLSPTTTTTIILPLSHLLHIILLIRTTRRRGRRRGLILPRPWWSSSSCFSTRICSWACRRTLRTGRRPFAELPLDHPVPTVSDLSPTLCRCSPAWYPPLRPPKREGGTQGGEGWEWVREIVVRFGVCFFLR